VKSHFYSLLKESVSAAGLLAPEGIQAALLQKLRSLFAFLALKASPCDPVRQDATADRAKLRRRLSCRDWRGYRREDREGRAGRWMGSQVVSLLGFQCRTHIKSPSMKNNFHSSLQYHTRFPLFSFTQPNHSLNNVFFSHQSYNEIRPCAFQVS
jgi:hypothetical protein